MNSYPLDTSVKMWIHAITTGRWVESKMVQDHICRHKARTTALPTKLFVALPNLSAHVLYGQPIVIQLPKIIILIYVQQNAMLHSLFYLETALHVSGGTIIHHQERKQLYLQHLVFVTPLLLSVAIVEELELV